MINPELKRGDRVVVLHMNDEFSSVPVGTAGTVTSKHTIFGEDQYEVKWDNGSRLSLISSEDIWDFEENVKRRKKDKIQEMTSTSSGGRYRVPIVLAPQDWEAEQMGAYTIPVSKYMNADLAYDSYDNKMERNKKNISKEESNSRKKSKMAKAMFSQNDGDGNPINGFIPDGSKVAGTPKQIKKGANLPKSQYKEVIKNYPQEKKIISKSRMVEDEGERFKQMVNKHGDIWKHFNVKFLQSYLITLRDSGVVNMFGAAPFLYMGKKKMDRYYGEYREDDEKFQKVLELADQAQAEMINGVIKYLESKGIEPDVNNLNKYVNRLASNVVQNYMLLF